MSKRAVKITLDPSHPAHSLFELLPSGRCYRALSTRTTRHRNSFFPQAIHLMNTWQLLWYTHYVYTYALIHLTHILSLHFNYTWYTCTYKTVHCYIPVNTLFNLYIVIPYLLVLVNSSFYYLCFGSVNLLHCGSFCHENKFLVQYV